MFNLNYSFGLWINSHIFIVKSFPFLTILIVLHPSIWQSDTNLSPIRPDLCKKPIRKIGKSLLFNIKFMHPLPVVMSTFLKSSCRSCCHCLQHDKKSSSFNNPPSADVTTLIIRGHPIMWPHGDKG